MRISIQQPEYFPWLGYFDKLRQVDAVVFLDNVQFKKRYFENRNKIRTADGWCWIRTPVLTKGNYIQDINQVHIDNNQPWQKKLIHALRFSYGKSPYWDKYGQTLCELISSREFHMLSDFNLEIIHTLMGFLNLTPKVYLASDLQTSQKGSELILEICLKVGADNYLSGRDGRNYLDEKPFAEQGVIIDYQDFTHPQYTQIHGEFIPAMSTIDLLANHGIAGWQELCNKGEGLSE